MVTRSSSGSWKFSWIILLNIFNINVEAGLTRQSSRITREVYPEIEPENEGNLAQACIVGDVVYATDELVPAEQPCLKCRCQPPVVQCETIRCIKKSGCKAIHRPNKCCPDYQCECHHEGKIYGNGERLKTPPGGECKVCYCRGGEVQCTKVSCYIRTDCEGRRVPGQCCPKYDHCPPKEPPPERPTISTDTSLPIQDVLQLWPLNKILQNSTEESTSPSIYETQDANKIETDGATTPNKITRGTQTDFTDPIKQIEQPKITIQEIIPEIKEIPITAPSIQPQPRPQLVIKESKEVIDDSNDLVTDAEPDSSEISEVFQHAPPVLRIGDKLLFLKQGELVPEKDTSTPSSVITIIGAEGLQRGFEESGEFHEISTEQLLFNNSNDLEPKAAESTHILSLVKHKRKPSSTTAASLDVSTTIDPLEFNKTIVAELINSTEAPSSPETVDQAEDVNKTTTSSTFTFVEENPAYPAIPEIMSPQYVDTSQKIDVNDTQQKTTNIKRTTQQDVKIIVTNDDDFKNESTKEPSMNYTSEAPTAEIELNTTIEETSTTYSTYMELIEANPSSVSTEYARSMESIEETTEDSGERTTPKEDHVSISEDASVEPSEIAFETDDMLTILNATTIPDVSVENVTSDGKPDGSLTKRENHNLTKESTDLSTKTDFETDTVSEDRKNVTDIMKDVEMINIENVTRASDKVEMELPVKIVEKRESSFSDDVFKELNDELNADSTERAQTAEEEQEESDKIFQELLEETSTPKSSKKLDKQAETVQKVTDAIAKITLRGSKNPFDSNVLGFISNFFSTQNRFENKK